MSIQQLKLGELLGDLLKLLWKGGADIVECYIVYLGAMVIDCTHDRFPLSSYLMAVEKLWAVIAPLNLDSFIHFSNLYLSNLYLYTFLWTPMQIHHEMYISPTNNKY